MQESSLESYRELVKSGQLGFNQWEVLREIWRRGPSTDRELAGCMGFTDPNRVRPRRNELVRKGLVEASGKRRCDVTGRLAIVWQYVSKSIQRELDL